MAMRPVVIATSNYEYYEGGLLFSTKRKRAIDWCKDKEHQRVEAFNRTFLSC